MQILRRSKVDDKVHPKRPEKGVEDAAIRTQRHEAIDSPTPRNEA